MIRICHPHDFDEMMVLRPGTSIFDGGLGFLINEGFSIMMQYVHTRLDNLTMTIQPSEIFNVPDANSENNDGCLNALQSNQSDVLLALVQYPRDVENVTQGLIVLETSLVMGAMYTKGSMQISQVLSSFGSFSVTVWLMCLFSFLCLSILLRWKNSMRRTRFKRNDYSFLSMVTHCVRLGAIDDNGFTRRLLFITASVYSLIVVHYFCSFIKTELVTIDDPRVFASYQDIMDRKAFPSFLRGMTYDLMFKAKDAPPYRAKLWNYSTANFDEDEIYLEFDPFSFLLLALTILIQKQVVVVDEILMPMIAATGCPWAARNPDRFIGVINQMGNLQKLIPKSGSKRQKQQEQFQRKFFKKYSNLHFDSMPDFNFFTAIDPNEHSHQLGVMMNEGYDRNYKSLFERGVKRALEVGLQLKLKDRLRTYDVFGDRQELEDLFGSKHASRRYLVEECMSCEIIRPDLEFHPLTIDNFNSLLKLMGFALPLLFAVLILEHLKSAKRSRRSRWRRLRIVSP